MQEIAYRGVEPRTSYERILRRSSKTFPGLFRRIPTGEYRPDRIVVAEVIVEIKSVARYHPVFLAQRLTSPHRRRQERDFMSSDSEALSL